MPTYLTTHLPTTTKVVLWRRTEAADLPFSCLKLNGTRSSSGSLLRGLLIKHAHTRIHTHAHTYTHIIAVFQAERDQVKFKAFAQRAALAERAETLRTALRSSYLSAFKWVHAFESH
eukprot:1156063-Pelagomonas_calceolata.AAC.5